MRRCGGPRRARAWRRSSRSSPTVVDSTPGLTWSSEGGARAAWASTRASGGRAPVLRALRGRRLRAVRGVASRRQTVLQARLGVDNWRQVIAAPRPPEAPAVADANDHTAAFPGKFNGYERAAGSSSPTEGAVARPALDRREVAAHAASTTTTTGAPSVPIDATATATSDRRRTLGGLVYRENTNRSLGLLGTVVCACSRCGGTLHARRADTVTHGRAGGSARRDALVEGFPRRSPRTSTSASECSQRIDRHHRGSRRTALVERVEAVEAQRSSRSSTRAGQALPRCAPAAPTASPRAPPAAAWGATLAPRHPDAVRALGDGSPMVVRVHADRRRRRELGATVDEEPRRSASPASASSTRSSGPDASSGEGTSTAARRCSSNPSSSPRRWAPGRRRRS